MMHALRKATYGAPFREKRLTVKGTKNTFTRRKGGGANILTSPNITKIKTNAQYLHIDHRDAYYLQHPREKDVYFLFEKIYDCREQQDWADKVPGYNFYYNKIPFPEDKKQMYEAIQNNRWCNVNDSEKYIEPGSFTQWESKYSLFALKDITDFDVYMVCVVHTEDIKDWCMKDTIDARDVDITMRAFVPTNDKHQYSIHFYINRWVSSVPETTQKKNLPRLSVPLHGFSSTCILHILTESKLINYENVLSYRTLSSPNDSMMKIFKADFNANVFLYNAIKQKFNFETFDDCFKDFLIDEHNKPVTTETMPILALGDNISIRSIILKYRFSFFCINTETEEEQLKTKILEEISEAQKQGSAERDSSTRNGSSSSSSTVTVVALIMAAVLAELAVRRAKKPRRTAQRFGGSSRHTRRLLR